MKSMPRWAPWLAVAGMVLGASVAGAWRPAEAPMAAPATIGVLRLNAVLDRLEQYRDMRASLEAMAAPIKAGLDTQREEIRTMQEVVNSGTLTGDRLFDARQDLLERQQLLEMRTEIANARFDALNGDMLRTLYQAVTAATTQFAQNNGYDLVFIDDRGIALAPPRSPTEVQAEVIGRKRVLFARESLDVTDQVLTLMNNQYASGGAGRP